METPYFPRDTLTAESLTEVRRVALVAELKRLRKGGGIFAPGVEQRIGPAIRQLCAIGYRDDECAIRRKLATRLEDLCRRLPDDLSLAALTALAVHPDARQALLRQRIRWLSERLGRDERTARRRVDVAVEQLAAVATSAVTSVATTPTTEPATTSDIPSARAHGRLDIAAGWYVERFDSLLRHDLAAPEAMEHRRIVATRDGLGEIVVSASLPRDPSGGRGDHDLLVEVLYGVRLIRKERRTESHFRFVLALPAPLRVGQRHEYGMLFRIPPRQPMRPHYVFTPLRRCDFFSLRVRFDIERPPESLWQVTAVPPRVIDDEPHGDPLALDGVGEACAEFQDLAQGFGYGLRWDFGDYGAR